MELRTNVIGPCAAVNPGTALALQRRLHPRRLQMVILPMNIWFWPERGLGEGVGLLPVPTASLVDSPSQRKL
jgi:hypothetical protein